jgi:hypothetical protein
MENIQLFIIYFTLVPVIITALIGLVRYQKLALTQRYLLVLTGSALLMELTSRMVLHYLPSNLFLAPIDTILEFSILALIYRRELRPARISRLIPLLAAGFVLGSIITYTPQLDFPYFNAMQRFIESLLVLAFVGVYFHREINRQTFTRRLEREPIFWISTGLLLYFLSSMFIFLTSNYVLTQPQELGRRVWAIHALLYIFLNILYAIAMRLPTRSPSLANEQGSVTQS